MNIKLYLLLIVLLLFVTCEKLHYKPSDEVNFQHIDKPSNDLIIDLKNPTDTLGVWGLLNIKYKFDTNYRQLENIFVYLDTVLLQNVLYDSLFLLNSFDFNDGLHELKIVIISQSGSGSLSDELGMETLKDSVMIPFVIDNAPLSSVQITSIIPSQSVLYLNWQKYPRFNFDEYRIYRHDNSLVAIIKDRNITSVKDIDYLGGSISYKIRVIAKNNYIDSQYFQFQDSGSKILHLQNNNNENITITWNRCKYDSAFASYILERNIYNWDPIRTITSITDTSFTDTEFYFGDYIYYRIKAISNSGYTYTFQDSFTYYGSKIENFSSLKYIPNTRYIYLMPNGDIYDADNLQIINSLDNTTYSNFTIDDLGNRAYCKINKSGVGNDLYICEIDPVSLAIIDTFYTPDIVGYNSIVGNMFAARDGKIFYEGYTYSSPTMYGDATFLIDVNTGQQIAKKSGNYIFAPQIRRIHPLNSYVFMKDYEYYLYSVGSSFFGILPFTSGNHFTFYETDKYITTTNNIVEVKELSTSGVVSSFSIQYDLNNPLIDPENGFLGGYTLQDNTYRVYDLSDGSIKYQLNIVTNNTYHMDDYWHGNKTLFSQRGFAIKMDY